MDMAAVHSIAKRLSDYFLNSAVVILGENRRVPPFIGFWGVLFLGPGVVA